MESMFTYRFMLPFGALICWIIFVILYEKHHWMRQHPQHSRLIFHHENHIKDIQGISLISVDNVKAGRGVCLSWINGYYQAQPLSASPPALCKTKEGKQSLTPSPSPKREGSS